MALTDQDRTLLRLTVAIVLGEWELLRSIRRSAGDGEPDRGWREAVLQAQLFAGVPRVVEAFGVLEQEGGLGAFDEGEVRTEPDQFARGRALFDRIYSRWADGVRDKLHGFHPDFAAWIEGHAYGRILARPGLGADRRELLAVASLAALGQDRQLASHVRGGLHCGASPAELHDALEAVGDLIGERHLAHAQRVVERFVRT